MAIEPVYKQVAEALVTCSSRALENFINQDPQEEDLDHAYAQLVNAHECLLEQYDHVYAQLTNAHDFLLELYNSHILAEHLAEDAGQSLGLEPQPGPPAGFSGLPLLEESIDLAAFCRTELSGLRTAIDTLTQVLEEKEAKNGKALLDLIKGKELSSEALNLILLRFIGKRTDCDARFAQLRRLYIDGARMSETTVKAKVTADSLNATIEGLPTDAEIDCERQRAWKTHQDKLRKAKEDMDDETANRIYLTEKIEQLEAMIKREIGCESLLRQEPVSDASSDDFGPSGDFGPSDDYGPSDDESAIDDDREGLDEELVFADMSI